MHVRCEEYLFTRTLYYLRPHALSHGSATVIILYAWIIHYLSVGVGQIELVADHDDRHVGRMLGFDDLVPDSGRLLERIGVGDGVDEHKRIGRRYWQSAHGRKFVRARRVQYVQVDFHAFHRELTVVHFLHGALVLGRELPVQELSDQWRFSHARRSHHHDLMPRHISRVCGRLQLIVIVATALDATTTVKRKKINFFNLSNVINLYFDITTH